MTHDQLMQALSPVRLPTPMAILSTAEMAALLALGIIAGAGAGLGGAALHAPPGGPPASARGGAAGLPVPDRLLAIARLLGHLPAALRPAAYGAAPPPSDRRIEAIARGARLRRPWRR